MTILVIGATGRVGRHVVGQLVNRGAHVRVFTRDPSKAEFPDGVEVAKGDLLDIELQRIWRRHQPVSAQCSDWRRVHAGPHHFEYRSRGGR